MTNKKGTKRALLSSVLALVLCLSMLVGTTFAWFTDSVTSGNNTITAGNLDIALEYWNGTAWENVNNATNLFTGNLWEPGHTEVVYLKLSNLGTLALKYQLGINIVSETKGTNVAGETFKLSDYIHMGVVENVNGETGAYDDRAVAVSAVSDAGIISTGYTKTGSMTAGQASLYMAVVVYMPETVGNEANYRTDTTAPFIDLGINLIATQLTSEKDSFGPDYDKLAPWTGMANTEWYNDTATEFTITSAEELAGLAQIVNAGTDTFNGKTVKLGANIDLNDIAWTPIGKSGRATEFNGTFIGTGYTISNLNVTGTKYVGLFGATYTGAHIEGVTIDGAYVSGNDYVGAVVGGGYLSANCIKDCTVKGAEIIATPYLMDNGKYDGGAKAGAIVGSAYNGNLTGNKAIECTITAYRDLGGIAGILYADGVTGRTLTASGNTVEKVTLAYLDLGGAAYDGNKVNENMGDVVGRVDSNSNMPVVENNTVTNVTRMSVITWIDEGVQYTKDVDKNVVTLYLVPADYEGTTVTVPEGVNAIGNYAFSQNTNVETVVLGKDVKDLGRGFDSNTSIKKVVLNEGLTDISSRAFKGTTALEEVVISSTVTTIADNAFQKSGIKNIVIPATVKTIGENAFGASLIETVTFEGNTSIQGYAFRGCTKLRTVYMKGVDVTFIASTLNGRNSCWFCNGESNNPNTSNITFYVVNDTVASRVKTAMGAEANNTPVIVGFTLINTAEELVALSGTKINGTYVLTADIDMGGAEFKAMSAWYASATFNGNGHTISNVKVISGDNDNGTEQASMFYVSTNGSLTVSNLTLKDITVATKNIDNGYAAAVIGYCEGNAVLNNVDVVNANVTGSKSSGMLVGHLTNNGSLSATNCDVAGTITLSDYEADGHYAGEYLGTMAGDVSLSNCTANVTLGGNLNSSNIGTIYGRKVSGELTVDNVTVVVSSATALDSTLDQGGNAVLTDDLEFSANDTTANSGYGATGVVVNGGVLDGNGNTLTVNDAWNTWDCAVNVNGGTIKNLTINSAMRGIFMGSATADVYIDNVVIDGTVYAFNSDGGNKNYGVYISNSTLNGWTSFSDVHKEVVFTNCNFGEGGGNAFLNAHQSVTFTNCEFEQGFKVNPANTTTYLTFENCTYNGVLITESNLSDVLYAASDAYLCIVNNN